MNKQCNIMKNTEILKTHRSLLDFFTQQKLKELASHFFDCSICFDSLLNAVNYFVDENEALITVLEEMPREKQNPFSEIAHRVLEMRLRDIYHWTETDSENLMEKLKASMNASMNASIKDTVNASIKDTVPKSDQRKAVTEKLYDTKEELTADIHKGVSLGRVLAKLARSPSLKGQDTDRFLNARGFPLNKIIEALLSEGHNPFEVLQTIEYRLNHNSNEEWFDMTTTTWLNLSVEKQIQYAKEYQKWYARQMNKDVEYAQQIGRTTLTLVLIPPGKFWRGSPESEAGRSSNEVRHKVLISKPFWCGKYPVTQEEYEAVIGTNPSEFKGDVKRPVENVSWEDCKKFCETAGFQLLSEAQWEYACRGGTTSAYSFGKDENQLRDYAWYEENSGKKTHSIGQKTPNAFGLYDIHGNVLEWCEDYYGEYPNRELLDPVNTNVSSYRVCRGACWNNSADRCRSAYRGWFIPSYRSYALGFRVCGSF
jgi:formylglycine-generating enzyme required for sulfatase activity